VQTVVNGPPQQTLLERHASGETEQELEPPRRLERPVREVPVEPDRDAKADEETDEWDRRDRPPGKPDERNRDEGEGDEKQRPDGKRGPRRAEPTGACRRGGLGGRSCRRDWHDSDHPVRGTRP